MCSGDSPGEWTADWTAFWADRRTGDWTAGWTPFWTDDWTGDWDGCSGKGWLLGGWEGLSTGLVDIVMGLTDLSSGTAMKVFMTLFS